MDSAPVVNIVENGNSTKPKNDEVTITVTLDNKESGSEAESEAVESEPNESLDQIETTQKQVDGKLSITDASTNTIEEETASYEAVAGSDAVTRDPTIEQSSITDNLPLRVNSVLKIEDDKPKIPIDVEEQDVIIEDAKSGDDGDESFSEDEDPNEPGTVSSELISENNNKNEITTTNEPFNEEENDLKEKGKEGLSIDKLENASLQSEHSAKKPTETKVIQPEEHIPVEIEYSDTHANDSVKSDDQKDFNNQIKEIISDIDINIKAQEKITQLKEQELKLIQKQNELASQIHQQQLLAQQLSDQNKLKPQLNQLEAERQSELEPQQFHQISTQPKVTVNLNQNVRAWPNPSIR